MAGSEVASRYNGPLFKVDGEPITLDECDGVVIENPNTEEPEFFFWTIAGGENAPTLRLASPGAGAETACPIDEIVTALEDGSAFPAVVKPDGRVAVARIATDDGEIRQEDDGKYTVTIESATATEVFTSDDQSKVMQDATNYLIREHNLLDYISIPWIPAVSKAVINDTPTYPDGEQEMRHYVELAEGYYLDTHYKKQDKVRRLRQMIEAIPDPDLVVRVGDEWVA